MGKRSRARALSVIFTCMLSSMLSGDGREEAVLALTQLGVGKLLVNCEWRRVVDEEEEEGQGVAYTQFLAARSLCITSLRDR